MKLWITQAEPDTASIATDVIAVYGEDVGGEGHLFCKDEFGNTFDLALGDSGGGSGDWLRANNTMYPTVETDALIIGGTSADIHVSARAQFDADGKGMLFTRWGTAQRPVSPAHLLFGMNTDGGYPEWYDSGDGLWHFPSETGEALPVADTTALVKGSVDPTKQVRMEVDGLTPATTRTITMIDADLTLVGTTTTQQLENKTLLQLKLTNATTLTIASGSVTRAQAYHAIDTEGGAGSDDLDTIAGGAAGDVIYIFAANDARTVNVRDTGGGTGNIRTYDGQSVALDEDHKILELICDGTNWRTVGIWRDFSAIHGNVSGEINAITAKATPVGADIVLIEDSAASFAKKKVTLTDLLASTTFLSPSPHLLMNTLATKTVVQGTWANTVNSAQMYGNIYNNVTAVAVNDEFEFEMALAAGTYTFKLLSLKDNASGIVTVRIDGSSIGTIDLYNAGGALNVVNTITSIVIATTGTKTINFKIESKNASSSNYIAYLTLVQFIKTA
jgi:hypothetical protein